MNYRNHSLNVTNSTVTNSRFVSGDQYVGTPPDVAELQRLLADHRAELVRLGGARGARVDSRIEEIDEQLETGNPDGSAVSSAWNSILNVLKGGAEGAESVSKISEVIRSLFGA
jgi:hypothetical protein